MDMNNRMVIGRDEGCDGTAGSYHGMNKNNVKWME